MRVDEIISRVIHSEGGEEYTNHRDDSGGPTKWGITLKKLSEWREAECTADDVKDLTESEAREIYRSEFWTGPGFHQVAPISLKVAEELMDTGVNMHPTTAVTFLQRILTAFNNRGRYYPDLVVDGKLGPKTLEALIAYLDKRGQQGQRVLLFSLDALQTAGYIDIAERREKDEAFVYGQIFHRAASAWRH